jgi:hypothetical protein
MIIDQRDGAYGVGLVVLDRILDQHPLYQITYGLRAGGISFFFDELIEARQKVWFDRDANSGNVIHGSKKLLLDKITFS